LAAFFIGTITADLVHVFFHLCIRSKNKVLNKIGSFHRSHHRFFTTHLTIEKEWEQKNFLHHILIEYLTQILGITLCLLIFPPIPILIAAILQSLIFLYASYLNGIDPHHRPFTHLTSTRGGWFVRAEYHALHHVNGNYYFSSYIKILDRILGTGHCFKNKRITITGASGALGSAMKKLLEKDGAIVTTFKFGEDYTYHDYEKLKEPLTNTDILVLCHGSKYDDTQQANCDSFVNIIELYKSVHKRGLVPSEIWGVGSEIEFHPCFGIKKLVPYANSKRNFAKHARQYFKDENIQYRHLVHSAFASRMGFGLMTADFAARASLFLIKRDFKYVPVSYFGFAYLNYFCYALS
jgi:hypothetical protein